MSNTLKYKATERYSLGWTDPRGMFGEQGNGYIMAIGFGEYSIIDTYPASKFKMEIMRSPINEPNELLKANKEEFATCIDAFLKEHRERNNSRL